MMASCRPMLCCIPADIVRHELWREFPQILLPGLLYSVITMDFTPVTDQYASLNGFTQRCDDISLGKSHIQFDVLQNIATVKCGMRGLAVFFFLHC